MPVFCTRCGVADLTADSVVALCVPALGQGRHCVRVLACAGVRAGIIVHAFRFHVSLCFITHPRSVFLVLI